MERPERKRLGISDVNRLKKKSYFYETFTQFMLVAFL